MITFIYSDGSGVELPMPLASLIVELSIVLAVIAAFYALRSIGLMVMSKKVGLSKSCVVFSWIPILWVFTACKLIGDDKVFGKPFQSFALLFCILFGVFEGLNFIVNFIAFFPIVGNVLMGRKLFILSFNTIAEMDAYAYANGLKGTFLSGVYGASNFVDPYGGAVNVLGKIISVCNYILPLLEIASIVITVMIYINLFKKYRPQHYMLFSILSIFGLFGPFVFAVRKREPIDYMDYVRSRYRYYGNPYGGNPYNNPYGNPPQNQQRPPETPFSEFAERGEIDPGDPFADFSNDKDGKKDE